MKVNILITERFNIPCQIKKGFDTQFHGLDVAHIKQPVAVSLRIISFLQLLIHQQRRRGVEPKIIMRGTQIRQMVIDSSSALPLLLLRVAEPFQIAVIVIWPYERDLFGHLQPLLIKVECFLVGHKDLRNFFQRLLHMLFKNIPLIGNSLLQQSHLFLLGQVAAHSRIMKSAHGQSVDILIRRRLAHSRIQLFQYGLFVGGIVPITILGRVPLTQGSVVEKQRLAMGSCDQNAIFISYNLILRMGIKRSRTTVHGWR